MKIPTREEINIYNSLDEITACDHYYGLSLKEAENLFIKDSLQYQWDLLWMGPKAFIFYIKAAKNYLKRKESVGDVDFIDALYQIIKTRWEKDELVFARPDLIDIVDYVIRFYSKFEVNEEIYGNLKNKFTELRAVIET